MLGSAVASVPLAGDSSGQGSARSQLSRASLRAEGNDDTDAVEPYSASGLRQVLGSFSSNRPSVLSDRRSALATLTQLAQQSAILRVGANSGNCGPDASSSSSGGSASASSSMGDGDASVTSAGQLSLEELGELSQRVAVAVPQLLQSLLRR